MRDPKIETWLDSRSVTWRFEEGVPLSRIDKELSRANQARFVPLSDEDVERYSLAIIDGAEFPPLVGYERKDKIILIDGNHRVAADELAEVTHHDIYMVKGAAPTFLVLTYEANNQNGRPNTKDERLAHGLHLAAAGASMRSAATAVGVPVNQLKYAHDIQRGFERAQSLKIGRLYEKLPQGMRARLANIRTDAAFVATVKLVAVAPLDTSEVSELVTTINSSRSEKRQLEIVADASAEYKERIQESGAGVLVSSRRWSDLRPKADLATALTILEKTRPEVVAPLIDNGQRELIAERVGGAITMLRKLASSLAK